MSVYNCTQNQVNILSRETNEVIVSFDPEVDKQFIGHHIQGPKSTSFMGVDVFEQGMSFPDVDEWQKCAFNVSVHQARTVFSGKRSREGILLFY